MVTYEEALKFVKKEFPDTKFAEKRIKETEYSYIINTNTEKYFETNNYRDMMVGGGPYLILKDSGEVYFFGSNPVTFGMVEAKTLDEFKREKQKFEKEFLEGKTLEPKEFIK